MNNRGVCVLSTGGTGGHVLPCVALASDLNDIGWEVIIFSDVRGLQFLDQNSRQYSIEIVSISSETLSLQKKIIELSYQVPLAALRAGKIMVRKKPKLVVGFGGLSMLYLEILRINNDKQSQIDTLRTDVSSLSVSITTLKNASPYLLFITE